MRGECPTHFENFVGRLDRAFEGSDVIDPSVWFSLSFEELIKKVGESPSWRSFANILNCIYIVKSVAEKKQQFNLTLQTSMEDVLMRFIKDKFRMYIQNVGGWQNLVEYVDNIRKWPVEGESLIDNLSLSSWAATGNDLETIFLVTKNLGPRPFIKRSNIYYKIIEKFFGSLLSINYRSCYSGGGFFFNPIVTPASDACFASNSNSFCTFSCHCCLNCSFIRNQLFGFRILKKLSQFVERTNLNIFYKNFHFRSSPVISRSFTGLDEMN